jgi:hypothetical protein
MNGSDFDTWEEFQTALASLESSALSLGSGILFRGQSNSEWALDTTLERRWPGITVKEYHKRAMNVRLPIQSFTGHEWEPVVDDTVLDLLSSYDSFSLKLSIGEMPAYDYLVYLRHHGFPSPLLDWSRSPFIAAYFAFSHSLTKEASDRIAIFAYIERPLSFKLRGASKAEIYVLGSQVPAHRRHFLQRSEYTVCVRWSQDDWRFAPHDEVLSGGQAMQDIIRKFTSPSSEGIKVLEEFDRYNLNGFSLFGSEESLMETMSLRETIRVRREDRNLIGTLGAEPSAGTAPILNKGDQDG